MFIRQGAEDIKQSLAVNANAAIVCIRLASASLWSIPPQDFPTEMTVESETRFRPVAYRRSSGAVIFGVDFEFASRKLQKGAEPKELIKISCTLEAEYLINPKFDPTDEQLKAFHRGNVVFNCWPYFREFIQNSSVRMLHAPPPVPFLRLMPPKKDSDKKRLSERKALKAEIVDK